MNATIGHIIATSQSATLSKSSVSIQRDSRFFFKMDANLTLGRQRGAIQVNSKDGLDFGCLIDWNQPTHESNTRSTLNLNG